jgi:hypothetical protein
MAITRSPVGPMCDHVAWAASSDRSGVAESMGESFTPVTSKSVTLTSAFVFGRLTRLRALFGDMRIVAKGLACADTRLGRKESRAFYPAR